MAAVGKSTAGICREGLILGALLLALLMAVPISLSIGRYPIPLARVVAILAGAEESGTIGPGALERTALVNVRLPRVLAAMMVGAALAVSGAAYQGIFKNPMVSPDLLGASAGAGFGVALGVLLGLSVMAVQLLAFSMGLLAVFITVTISLRVGRGQDMVLIMVLAGILVGSVFMAFIATIKYMADPYEKLPVITFWLMGGLSAVNAKDVAMVAMPVAVGLVPLVLLRWKLNVLSLGDEEARALGVDSTRIRLAAIVCATMMTAVAVSISGMIGWVGLVVPHLARLAIGPNYKSLLPASALLGALYLLLIDDFVRCIASVELPLGVLTALVGAPFFILLLMRLKKGW
jgi:iron complex transport system permease protein